MPHADFMFHHRARRATTAALTLAALAGVLSLPALAQSTPAGTAVTTSSGLQIRILAEGRGASPKASDVVRVHYRGTLADGSEFDSSIKRGKPAEFPLNRVIPCWTEGLQRMQVGAKAQLLCPPAIAYGSRGAGGVIPPNATLTFEVELLGIVAGPKAATE